MHLSLVALVVEEYDPAIEFFVRTLGFDLVEDSPSQTNDGRPKAMGGGPPAGRPRAGLLPSSCPGG
jgi:catechol 2,3-dioxygenase-like lactoylglutathione lyase family enzyme